MRLQTLICRVLLPALTLVPALPVAADSIWYVDLKRVDFPMVSEADKPFGMRFSLSNSGMEPITSVDIRYQPMGGTPVTVHHQFSVPPAAGEEVEFDCEGFRCDMTGPEVYGDFFLDRVNGEVNYGSGTYLYLFCAGELLPRRLVVEEASSLMCGFCPRGYVSMELMRDSITDGSWIGISYQEDGDDIGSRGDFPGFWCHVSGKPAAFANRDYEYAMSPLPAVFANLHSSVMRQAAVAAVSATLDYDSDSSAADVSASVRFVFDYPEADFRLAYIITEDGLGPYEQLNYFSGGYGGQFMGWEDKPWFVPLVYNDVARPGSVHDGVAGLLPAQIERGRTYNADYRLDLRAVRDAERANVSVLVIDGATGRVVNAVRVPVVASEEEGGEESGISAPARRPVISVDGCTLVIDSGRPVSVCSAGGRVVASGITQGRFTLPAGVYVVRGAGICNKVLVK